MSGKLAIVFCVHHKPWLMMGTLITFVSQEYRDADVFFAYNVGDGAAARESYREYYEVAARAGVNPQLSPFDDRVRDVCRLRGINCFEVEYENDHGLDSGTWYKFIKGGRWRAYEHVLFVGEGMLFANPRVVSALVAFADRRPAPFITSGHEKRRVPRSAMTHNSARGQAPTEMDAFHDRMIEETFAIFCRDPAFRSVHDRWGSDFAPQTEHHVPGVARNGAWPRRLRAKIQKRWGSPYAAPQVSLTGRLIRPLPHVLDRWTTRACLGRDRAPGGSERPTAYIGGTYEVRPAAAAEDLDTEQGVAFHRVAGPEWFGCAVSHLISRTLLERLSERLERFGMYDVIDLPFSGSALEVIWGFVPEWLGVEKWFTNGFHRVRKQFSTYQREDYPPEMASYINRYHAGRLVVDWEGDYLKLRAWRPDLGDLKQVLPSAYF